MDILATCTGLHHPYSIGLVREHEQPGPSLSLFGAKSFDGVIPLSTHNTAADRRLMDETATISRLGDYKPQTSTLSSVAETPVQ